MHFDPFSFDATGYASIAAGVSISVDLGWFGTIEVDLSFHLGATVRVHGPDFSGSASIDLDVTSATISFGSGDDNSTKQLPWSDFSAKYLTAGASVLSAMPQAGQLTGTATMSPWNDAHRGGGQAVEFVAEWSLSVATTAAATALQLKSSMLPYDLSQVPGIASMAIDAITSTLAVAIAGSAGGDVAPPILGPSYSGEGLRVALVTARCPGRACTANRTTAASRLATRSPRAPGSSCRPRRPSRGPHRRSRSTRSSRPTGASRCHSLRRPRRGPPGSPMTPTPPRSPPRQPRADPASSPRSRSAT